MDKGRVPIMLVFYRLAEDGEPFVNRLAAWWQGSDLTHVEFFDPNKKLAASVWQGELVELRHRTFSNPQYRFRTLYVTADQREKMLACAKRAVGKPFNLQGLYRSATWVPRPCDDRCYFCSELATRILQAGGLLRNYEPGMMTPTMLYNLLATASAVGMNPNACAPAAAHSCPTRGRLKSSAQAHNPERDGLLGKKERDPKKLTLRLGLWR